MKNKKILVVYYSRTGNTRKVGKMISKILKADSEEIIDKKNRSGILGWIFGGRDAMMKKGTEIEYKKDPSKYNLVVIGTPIWVATVTPAIRTYLESNKIKKVAFFCTYGGSSGKSFDEMKKLSKKPLATLGIKAKELELHDAEIKVFCKNLK